MIKLRFLSLAAVFVTAAAAGSASAAEMQVTDPADAALLIAIDNAVISAGQSIAVCRDAGGSLAACYCDKKADIALIGATLAATLAAHPEWADRALTFDIGEGATRTILLSGVAKMAELPDCN